MNNINFEVLGITENFLSNIHKSLSNKFKSNQNYWQHNVFNIDQWLPQQCSLNQENKKPDIRLMHWKLLGNQFRSFQLCGCFPDWIYIRRSYLCLMCKSWLFFNFAKQNTKRGFNSLFYADHYRLRIWSWAAKTSD